MVEVRHGAGRLRWAKVAGAVESSPVVTPNVLREYHTQVPLVEDQHAIGEFGSEVRTNRSAKQFARGQRGGILTTRMPTSARTTSNDAANWPARSQTRHRNWVTRPTSGTPQGPARRPTSRRPRGRPALRGLRPRGTGARRRLPRLCGPRRSPPPPRRSRNPP